MSGWVTPTRPTSGTAGGPVAWATPEETPGLSVGQLIRGAWRLYRSAGRRLLLAAAVPESIQILFSLPGIAVAVVEIKAALLVFANFRQFSKDPYGFQAAVQAAVRPPGDLLVLVAITGGIGIAVTVTGWAMVTAVALAASEGQPVRAAQAFRIVLARKRAIVMPAIVVGIGWALVTAAQAALTPARPVLTTPSQSAAYGLLGLAIVSVSVAAFVMAVVWSLALPAILVEKLGLRSGLARGAALTRGIRMRLGLAFIVVWILQGLSVGIVASLAGLIGGLLAWSIEVGAALYVIALFIGAILWLPFLPAMLAVAYRDRTKPDDVPAVSEAPAVAEPPVVPEPPVVADAG